MKPIPDDAKAEVIRLRVQERLGIRTIERLTGLSRGTVSNLLREYPLTEEEIRQKITTRVVPGGPKPYRPEMSKYAVIVQGEVMDRRRKGQIAEAAVLFRLTLFGYEVWRSQFDCNGVDWLVSRPTGHSRIRIQVRWARRGKHGRPAFSTRKHGNQQTLSRADCDFVVAYDLETDTAFVCPVAELTANFFSCKQRYAEAWGLLGILE